MDFKRLINRMTLTRHQVGIPVLIWCLVALIYCFFQFRSLQTYNLELFPDSGRYVFPTPIFSLENSGILTSIFFRAFDGFIGINAMQVLVSSLSWLSFSYVVLIIFQRYWGLMGSIIVLTLSLQVSIINWNYLALSESLAISITVFWFACLLWINTSGNTSNQKIILLIIWVTQLAFLLVLLVRPQLIVVAAPLQLLVMLNVKTNWTSNQKMTQFAVFSAISAVGAFRLIIASVGSPFKGAYSGHLVENRSDFATYAFEKFDCVGIDGSGDGVLEQIRLGCPDLYSSLTQGSPSFISWTLEQPLSALSNGFRWLFFESKLVDYSSDVFIISEEFGNFLIPTYSSLTNIYFTFLLGGILFGALSFQNLKIHVKNLLLWLTLNVTSFAFIFVSWGIDGIELERHSMPMLALLPVFSAVLASFIFYPQAPQLAANSSKQFMMR